MKIAQFLPPEAIIPSLTASNKLQALDLMISAMHELGYISDPEVARHDVLLREAKMTTGIGRGIAVPHARTKAAKGLHALLARHPEGLDWAALDGQPVHFIVLALSPPDAPGPHLQFVASIARLLHDDHVLDALMTAHTARRMYEILNPPKKRRLF